MKDISIIFENAAKELILENVIRAYEEVGAYVAVNDGKDVTLGIEVEE